MHTEMNEQTDILLVKYMLGETTANEKQEVTAWLAQDSANQQYYEQLQTIWQKSKQLEPHTTVNENDAWQRFQQRAGNGNPSISTPAARVLPLRRIAAAAAVVLLAAGGWWLYQSGVSGRNTVTLTATSEVVTDTLPDGSVVTLNKNAQLNYRKNLASTDNNRKVNLEGEAFFNIAPDKNKPFVITAGDVTVKVLGTSFNIKRTATSTEIIVASGAIEVVHHNQAMRLQQQEKIVVTTNDNQLQKQQNNSELYSYYHTRQFVCKNTPLYQLVNVLNEAYDAHIVIANKAIQSLPLTTTFQQQPVDSIITVITQTLGIEAKRQNHQIILQ
ncbi:FecR family protein [Filimonas lacunae]|uniref:FecR family protein n=1 Tax=Filimonas lacunae TaxID=477680 RepID=A0A173MQ50_9BACT|nr:FecR domain-containing protein [Filimonas lacunae]BAV09805.1 anti-sigma factor [Filimonas lacunae]SIS79201.1 FecR family protein [Filimonas lacunae]